MELLFSTSFARIFLVALTTMIFSSKSSNTHQARLSVHYTGALKNK
tara:strand:- start:622 stop:759 length:138 start_codon:yes stop_codon:yes gene_type:complete